jgi:hypothetical protein
LSGRIDVVNIFNNYFLSLLSSLSNKKKTGPKTPYTTDNPRRAGGKKEVRKMVAVHHDVRRERRRERNGIWVGYEITGERGAGANWCGFENEA